jgi:hypothetical protein
LVRLGRRMPVPREHTRRGSTMSMSVSATTGRTVLHQSEDSPMLSEGRCCNVSHWGQLPICACRMHYLSLFSLTDRSWNQSSWSRADSEPASNFSPDHRPQRSSPYKSWRTPALFRRVPLSPLARCHADKDKADFIIPVPLHKPDFLHLSHPTSRRLNVSHTLVK